MDIYIACTMYNTHAHNLKPFDFFFSLEKRTPSSNDTGQSFLAVVKEPSSYKDSYK